MKGILGFTGHILGAMFKGLVFTAIMAGLICAVARFVTEPSHTLTFDVSAVLALVIADLAGVVGAAVALIYHLTHLDSVHHMANNYRELRAADRGQAHAQYGNRSSLQLAVRLALWAAARPIPSTSRRQVFCMSNPGHSDHTTPDGAQYPTDNVVALFPSREDAGATKAALIESGFAEDDITLYHGQEGLREIESDQTPLTRLREALDRLSQDAGVDRDLHMADLGRGESLLMLYAPDDATVDRAPCAPSARRTQSSSAPSIHV